MSGLVGSQAVSSGGFNYEDLLVRGPSASSGGGGGGGKKGGKKKTQDKEKKKRGRKSKSGKGKHVHPSNGNIIQMTSGAARGKGRSFPLWVDVHKLCNMCVLSLSWNFFVSHDKYIARPSSKEPR